MKISGRKVTAAALIVIVLTAAFFLGGPVSVQEEQPTSAVTAEEPPRTEPAATPGVSAANPGVTPAMAGAVPSDKNTPEAAQTPEILPVATPAPTAVGDPVPVQTAELPPEATAPDAEDEPEGYTCTLSVTCEVLLEHLDELEEGKRELIPEDGVIFPKTEVPFYEGESVFNVLRREMKTNRIHLEFTETPLYQSVYIEGIGNLYELDCGDLSGWVYRVNGSFPDCGCSNYLLQDGDNVEWLYTCDLGKDAGGGNGGGGASE